MKLKSLITLVFPFLFLLAEAQNKFQIEDGKKKYQLSFELVNNLVVIPVEINGLELSFLLDTGVSSTILFSLDKNDSLNLKQGETILLRGLGDGEPFKAIKSTGNLIKIGKAYNDSLPLYVVYDNPIGLSNRMGIPIHGIIGYDFFKDFVLEFNYVRKKIKVHDPNSFTYSQCRRCDEIDLIFHKDKPYVNILADINGNKNVPLNLLIDSGSGDALWVFSDAEKNLKVPDSHFEDFLGYGMGGSVYGLRSRISAVHIGSFNLKKVTASFPDTSYFKGIGTFESRNGSIGSIILSRFHSVFDYPNKKLRLKPNRYYNDPFEYDMSGISVAHEGYTVIRNIRRNPGPEVNTTENTTVGETVYKSTFDVEFSLKPQYKIVEVRKDSPAAKAGLQIGDIVLEINNRPSHRFSLSKINELFSSSEGKKIKLKIEREGKEKVISFILQRIL